MPTTPTTSNVPSAVPSDGPSGVPRHGGAPAAPSRTQAPRPVPARRRVPRWSVPFAAAVVAAAVWSVGAALGVDPVARTGTGTQEIGIAAVVVTALVVGFAAWGVRALSGRLRSGGERAWLVTCGVVLLVSLLGPLGGVGAGAVALLVVEHLAVGTTLAVGLRR